MKGQINLILAIASAVVYISVIIMKFFTTIDIANGSFIIVTLLFIISMSQFISALF